MNRRCTCAGAACCAAVTDDDISASKRRIERKNTSPGSGQGDGSRHQVKSPLCGSRCMCPHGNCAVVPGGLTISSCLANRPLGKSGNFNQNIDFCFIRPAHRSAGMARPAGAPGWQPRHYQAGGYTIYVRDDLQPAPGGGESYVLEGGISGLWSVGFPAAEQKCGASCRQQPCESRQC